MAGSAEEMGKSNNMIPHKWQFKLSTTISFRCVAASREEMVKCCDNRKREYHKITIVYQTNKKIVSAYILYRIRKYWMLIYKYITPFNASINNIYTS